MSELQHIDEPESAESLGALSYSIELWDARGERLEAVLGIVRSPSLGFACYYGALHEYAGRRVVLRNHDQVIAASAPEAQSS